MDIDQFYKIVQFITNKNQQGYLSPDEFNNALNLAQSQLMNDLVDQIQGWDGAKRRIRLPMGNAQQAIQKVAPFIVKSDPSTGVPVDNDGVANKPIDLIHMLAIRVAGNLQRVKRVEHDRVYSNLSSKFDSPSIGGNPFYVEYAEFYQFYPSTIGVVNWEYIGVPPAVRWDYTILNGRPVFNLSGSVNPLWKETEITELMSRVLFMFGISVQAQNLVGYYQNIKNDGQ